MTKRALILLPLALASCTLFGQLQQMQVYTNLYRTADSLNNVGRLYAADNSILKEVNRLDRKHPEKYFEAIGDCMKQGRFDDAAFLYYLGILRYRYYNRANPRYQASGDGALLASFEYMAGGPINLYVRTNIDNFVAILKASSGYFAQHDYPFYPRAKSPANYDSAATIYSILINDIQTNREKYQKQWDEQRNQLMQGVDKANDTYDKMTLEQKKRLDANKQQDSTKQ
jgi:hypothetical protein